MRWSYLIPLLSLCGTESLAAQAPELLPASPLKVGDDLIDSSKLIGYSSPQLIDYDKDGDLDLVLGSFIGRFRFFEKVGPW